MAQDSTPAPYLARKDPICGIRAYIRALMWDQNARQFRRKPTSEMKTDLRDAGFKTLAIERAKASLGIRSEDLNGIWYWVPDQDWEPPFLLLPSKPRSDADAITPSYLIHGVTPEQGGPLPWILRQEGRKATDLQD